MAIKWRTAIMSGDANCGQVGGEWVRAQFSSANSCAEVLQPADDGFIHFRDSDRPEDCVKLTPASWQAFIDSVKAGQFDIA